jgi:uncharacterized membrane protein
MTEWEEMHTELEPNIRNTLAILLFGIGLPGIGYSLFSTVLHTDNHFILLLPSIGCLAGAYLFLARDNDRFPRGRGTREYYFLLMSLVIWMAAGAYVSLSASDTTIFIAVSGFLFICISCVLFELLWRNRQT